MSKDDHLVWLIGSKYKGSVALTRRDYPHLDARAGHSDLACLHCGYYFPLRELLPQSVGMVSAIQKQFSKEHRNCTPGKVSPYTISGGKPTDEEIDACLAAKEEKPEDVERMAEELRQDGVDIDGLVDKVLGLVEQEKGAQRDLNPRPPESQSGALTS